MQPLTYLAGLIQARSGIVVATDKEYLFETRLAPLLRREALGSLADLAERLAQGGCEALKQDVTEALATHETLFFRDAKFFAHLLGTGLPALVARRPPGAVLRIWSAAASTGQEAYSLAMVCAELDLADRIGILGTDLARRPLEQAREGLYTQHEVQRGLSTLRLLRHFTPESPGPAQSWRIQAKLRAMCSFRQWNLLDDTAPLGQFDVIFCRNVLFYFDRPVRTRVLEAIRQRLAPDGLLYLGATESATGIDDGLQRDGPCYVANAGDATRPSSASPFYAGDALNPSHPALQPATVLRPARA